MRGNSRVGRCRCEPELVWRFLLWKIKPVNADSFLYYRSVDSPTEFGPYKVVPSGVGIYAFPLTHLTDSGRFMYKIVAVSNNLATISEGTFDWTVDMLVDSKENPDPSNVDIKKIVKSDNLKPLSTKVYSQKMINQSGCGINSLSFRGE